MSICKPVSRSYFKSQIKERFCVTVWSIFGLELASFPFSRRRYWTHELSKLAYWRASVARLFFSGWQFITRCSNAVRGKRVYLNNNPRALCWGVVWVVEATLFGCRLCGARAIWRRWGSPRNEWSWQGFSVARLGTSYMIGWDEIRLLLTTQAQDIVQTNHQSRTYETI